MGCEKPIRMELWRNVLPPSFEVRRILIVKFWHSKIARTYFTIFLHTAYLRNGGLQKRPCSLFQTSTVKIFIRQTSSLTTTAFICTRSYKEVTFWSTGCLE